MNKASYNTKIFDAYCKDMRLPEPVYEHQHIPLRKFRCDIAWPKFKVGIEVEGGIYARSRMGHSTGASIEKDMEKNNLALMNGWQVLRVMPEDLIKANTIIMVRALMFRASYPPQEGE